MWTLRPLQLTAKVMMWLSPQHPFPTTRPPLPLLKLVVRFPFNDIYGFCWVLIVLVKCSLLYGYPKMEQVKMLWLPPQHQIPQLHLTTLQLPVRTSVHVCFDGTLWMFAPPFWQCRFLFVCNRKMMQVRVLWLPKLELLVRELWLYKEPLGWFKLFALKNVLTRNLMQCKGLGTLSVVVWHGHSLMFKNAAWQVSNKSIPVVTNVCLVEVEQLCLEQWHTVGFHPINVQLKRFLFLLPVVSHTTEVWFDCSSGHNDLSHCLDFLPLHVDCNKGQICFFNQMLSCLFQIEAVLFWW